MTALRRLLKRAIRTRPVIVVSGLPRSGTSMMMKMLEAGGLEALVDGLREADVDNPGGYYELERVKKLPDGDHEWVAEAQGKVVKVISELLRWLPEDQSYRIVFMHRDMDEIIRSQRTMLNHRSQEQAVAEREMAQVFEAHLNQVERWLAEQDHMEVIYVRYSELLADPEPALDRVNRLLGGGLDVGAMTAVVDPTLYRSGR